MREEEEREGGREGRSTEGWRAKPHVGWGGERVKMERDTDGEKWITAQTERE